MSIAPPSMQDKGASVPFSAAWLGGLGAIPFVCLASALPFVVGEPRVMATHALIAYGATILSFLGGIHWGLSIGTVSTGGPGGLPARLIASVIPALIGWIALLLREPTGLLVLAAAFAAMLWFDLRATRRGEAPPWYPKLRIPLTLIVVASLLFGATA